MIYLGHEGAGVGSTGAMLRDLGGECDGGVDWVGRSVGKALGDECLPV